MFDTLRSIQGHVDALQREAQKHDSFPSHAPVPRAAKDHRWLFPYLCQNTRRERLLVNNKDESKDIGRKFATPGGGTSPTAGEWTARHQTTEAGMRYAPPLTAATLDSLQRRAPAPFSVTDILTEELHGHTELSVVSDALPMCTLWGSVLRLWCSSHGDCPTLRTLASTIQAQYPSLSEGPVEPGIAGMEDMCVVLKAESSSMLQWLLDGTGPNRNDGAPSRMNCRLGQRRPRSPSQHNPDETPRTAARVAGTKKNGEDRGSTTSYLPHPAPLRATSARAQAAASRSRSTTPPSRSRSQSPPPSTFVAPPTKSVTAAPIRHSPFSFGVRSAEHSGGKAAVTPQPKQQPHQQQPWEEMKDLDVCGRTRITDDRVAPRDGSPRLHETSFRLIQGAPAASPPGPLRQTTLATFARGFDTSTSNQCQQQPQPPASSAKRVWFSQSAHHQQQQPQQQQNIASSKAPPYKYNLRHVAGGSGDTSGIEQADERGSHASTVALGSKNCSSPSSSSGPSTAAGGFVTAGEQLLTDIRQGRAMSSTYLSNRSPALGLRRNASFQPPYPQQQQTPAGTTDARMGLRSITGPSSGKAAGGASGKAGQTNGVGGARGGDGGAAPAAVSHNHGDGDEDNGSYPTSLLLPDGSVPPILLPLDPKLVAQVAMEILDHGAGARQVGWDDIAGLQHAKSSVEEAIVWPLRRPDLFVGLRDPPRGLLLFGPPGTGKTMIARAIANRAACTFLNISSSSLMSKWMGDGEKLVRCLFAVAIVKQPSVIFIDEVDSLLSARGEGEMDSVRRVKTEFLVQLDGVATDGGDRVLLIGATNRPDELDEAARRRMEKRLYIPLPDEVARRELIQRLLKSLGPSEADKVSDGDHTREAASTTSTAIPSVAYTLTESDLDNLVRSTEGYSGADLKQLCREAAMGPLREMSVMQLNAVAAADLRPVQCRDFKRALKRLKPSVGPAEVRRYAEWNRLFGSFTEGDDDDDDDEGRDTD